MMKAMNCLSLFSGCGTKASSIYSCSISSIGQRDEPDAGCSAYESSCKEKSRARSLLSGGLFSD